MSKPLTKETKEKILRLLAEDETYQSIADATGCHLQTIKKYAAEFKESIETARQVLITETINKGFANKEYRVRKLNRLAKRLEAELEKEPDGIASKKGGLYYTEIKLSSTGDTVEYEVFNAGMVKEYRSVLDDIAKEKGERINKAELDLKGNILAEFTNLSIEDI